MAEHYSNFSLTTFSTLWQACSNRVRPPSRQRRSNKRRHQSFQRGRARLGKKPQTALIDESTISKVANLTENVAATYAGMGSDFRVL
eukprot:GABV01005143.1.p1 GENE.GABV01005143.1~~GABV01005143.1.p1  ORF type:complete len:101 (+),score=22.28 GABV01005143.1:44-304(+)